MRPVYDAYHTFSSSMQLFYAFVFPFRIQHVSLLSLDFFFITVGLLTRGLLHKGRIHISVVHSRKSLSPNRIATITIIKYLNININKYRLALFRTSQLTKASNVISTILANKTVFNYVNQPSRSTHGLLTATLNIAVHCLQVPVEYPR